MFAGKVAVAGWAIQGARHAAEVLRVLNLHARAARAGIEGPHLSCASVEMAYTVTHNRNQVDECDTVTGACLF